MSKQKQLSDQSKLIGEHPKSGLFFDWFECEDTFATTRKKHRKLINKGIESTTLVNNLAQWIIKHHFTEEREDKIKKKKQILDKHKFAQSMVGQVRFPIESVTTQKGNLAEIILAEYLTDTSGLETLVYKLRYNPNVEQSMKGDDILLFEKKNIQNKVIMGEAKFRENKDKKALDDIIKSLSSKNLPISLSFVSNMLEREGKTALSEEIDDLITKLHNDITPITFVGFYFSELTAYQTIEKNLDSDNDNLVIVSYSEDNPSQLVKNSFEKALDMIMN